MNSDEALAQTVTNKILQISSGRHFQKLRGSNPVGGHVFHYTTVSGLQGIVQTNCIHAGGAYYLNDSSELEYGRRILGRVLDQWELENPEARDDATAELVRDLRANIIHESGLEALVDSVYLTCFCERDNVLSQWRGYGQAGGYSIGFPVVDGSIQRLAPESPSHTAVLTRIEYEDGKQVQKCKEILDLILPVVDDSAVARILRATTTVTYHGPMSTYDFILKVAEEMLVDEILGFKAEAFEVEHEWRLIVRPRTFLLQGRDDRGKTPTKRYFRPVRGILAPYLKLVPLGGSLPIVSIRSGPSIDRARAEASLRLLLAEYDYLGVVLSGSEIPVLM